MQIGVAKRAADRISIKLAAAKRSGKAVDMEEEFRLLTLQVIGEAVLSLPAAECDRVGQSSLMHSAIVSHANRQHPADVSYRCNWTEPHPPGCRYFRSCICL